MIVEYTIIDSLDQVDLSSLFDASADVIDYSYRGWPSNQMSIEEKKEFYINSVIMTFSEPYVLGRYPLGKFIAFKATVNGIDSLVNMGYVKDDCYTSYWYLTAPDSTGSRNWIFASRNIMHAFYREQGFNSFKFVTYQDSLLARNARMRHNSGHVQILEQKKIDDIHIEIKVKVNDASVLTA